MIYIIILFLLIIAVIGYSFTYSKPIPEPKQYWSIEDSIKQAKSQLRTDEPFQTLDIMLAGYSFDDRQTNIINNHEFEKVKLLPEPSNEFDENAIIVLNKYDKIMGYIPAPNNKQILTLLEGSFEYEAYLKKTVFTKKEEFIPVIVINFYKN